jgi:hypothetical protein
MVAFTAQQNVALRQKGALKKLVVVNQKVLTGNDGYDAIPHTSLLPRSCCLKMTPNLMISLLVIGSHEQSIRKPEMAIAQIGMCQEK